jgi:3-oxoacyl-(acyl-carrier-protein) synthase
MSETGVVVTGLGMVTPLGTTAPASAEAWNAGRRADLRVLEDLAGTSMAGAEVAALPEFDPAQRLGERRMLKYMSDAAVLGCVAAREAATQANIRSRFRPERIGLYAGTGLAAANVKECEAMIRESIDGDGNFSCGLFGSRGLAATNPLLSFKILANMPACLVSILECVRGPNYIFTPWEGQTASALVEAWHAVRNGEVDCALAGAADCAAHPSVYVFLKQAGHLREGQYAASAAAYLVLERVETAQRNAQPVLADIPMVSVADRDNGGPGGGLQGRGVTRKQAEACTLAVSEYRLQPASCAPLPRPNDSETLQGAAADPLESRMGRCFAAAPAVLLAMKCLTDGGAFSITGVDGAVFAAEVRRPA